MNKLDRKRPKWSRLSRGERLREQAALQRRQRELKDRLQRSQVPGEVHLLELRIDAMQGAVRALRGRG